MRDRERAEDRLPREPEELPREAEPAPAADVLRLQRSAGNRAVSALLARQPAAAEPTAKDTERGSTMTLGLGDDIVIPLESVQWDLKQSELHVMFVSNPASPELWLASAEGRSFATGFLSTQALMSTFKNAVITNYQTSDRIDSITVNFKDVTHKPVK